MIRLLLISFFSLSFFFSYAQTGIIRGTVKDDSNKEDIIGASVYVLELNKGAATDINGFFSISKVPSGTYRVRITYVGYKQKIIDIKVLADKVTEINTSILEDKKSLDEVKIVATRQTNTEISLISEIKATQIVVSGISAQQIGKTLDRDAAQVVKRVPGVTIFNDKFINIRGLNQRYNVALLHNAFAPSMESDSRSFSFDIIPSSQIDRILVFKSPSAELPGEFAGGVVKIFTKGIIDENNLTIDYSTSFRENTTNQSFLSSKQGTFYYTGFNDGYPNLPKFFPATRSELLGSSPERLQQIGQSLRNTWSPVTTTTLPDQRLSIISNYKFRLNGLKIGNITAVNYSLSSQIINSNQREFAPIGTTDENLRLINDFVDIRYNQSIRMGAMHNWSVRINENHSIEFKNLYNQLSNAQTIYRTGFDGNNNYHANNYSFDQIYRGIYTGQLVGTHKFNNEKTKIDWMLGYNSSYRDQPDYRRYRTDVDISTGTQTLFVPSGSAQPFFLGRTFLKLNESANTGAVNFSQKIIIKKGKTSDENRELELKAGVFYEAKNRDFATRNLGYVRAKQESFNIDVTQPIGLIFQPQNINTTNGLKIDEQTNASDSYTASNDQLAGYLSSNVALSKHFNVIAGIRLENNQLILNSALKEGTPINYNNKVLAVLPSVNATYNFSEKSLLRLAYGQTVNRPEFREVAPFSFYDFVINRVTRGNPNLVNCTVDNMDFRYEFYPTPAEIISFAVFHKNFTNPIEVVFEGGANSTPLVTFQNGKSATSTGIELEVRKNFASISSLPFLNKLSVVFNAAFIQSKVKLQDNIVGQSDNRPLQGQSPYIINAGLNYQNHKKDLQINLLYNVIGKRIYAVGFNNGGNALYPDWYETPRNVIDLTFAKGFGSHLLLKGGINDILNQFNYIIQDSNQDSKIDASTDQVIQAYRPGRLVTIGLSYSFAKRK